MACEDERQRVKDIRDIIAAGVAARQGTYNFSTLAAGVAWVRVYGASTRSPRQLQQDLDDATQALLLCEGKNAIKSFLPDWLDGAGKSLGALFG
jgi:hypothetical protein